jgi:hypothetical protein
MGIYWAYDPKAHSACMRNTWLPSYGLEDNMAAVKDAMKAMEGVMSKGSIARSDEINERELLMLKLGELRAKYKENRRISKDFLNQPFPALKAGLT